MPLNYHQDNNTTQVIHYILVLASFCYNKAQFMESVVSSMPNSDRWLYLAKSQQKEIQLACKTNPQTQSLIIIQKRKVSI